MLRVNPEAIDELVDVSDSTTTPNLSTFEVSECELWEEIRRLNELRLTETPFRFNFPVMDEVSNAFMNVFEAVGI